MNTLPLDCLVANFLACECRPDPVEEDEGIYSIPLDDSRWMGVQTSEMNDSLVFFAHPGPSVSCQYLPYEDQESPEQLFEEMEVGDDDDGSWVLTVDKCGERYTLWLRADRQEVGHAEFARIVDNLRWRFLVWDEVLASWNDSLADVTQEIHLT